MVEPLLFESMVTRAGVSVAGVLLDTRALHTRQLIGTKAWREASADILAMADQQLLEQGASAYAQQIQALEPNPAVPVPPAQLRSKNSRRGIIRALRTIEESEAGADISMRLARLGESLVARSAQEGYRQAMLSDPAVEGWYRGLNADACQLCVWWWREGMIWEKDRHLQSHKGCKCTQIPVRLGADSDSEAQQQIKQRNDEIAQQRLEQTEEAEQ